VKPKRKPPDLKPFLFEEVDGVKRLTQFSNSTATVVFDQAPLFDKDLFNAREFVQRKGDDLVTVKATFPRLANLFYDDELKASLDHARTERSWVTEVFSKRLRYPPETIDRWRRKESKEKPAKK
jgi:hypothetical protein